jgi:hypothetical protein
VLSGMTAHYEILAIVVLAMFLALGNDFPEFFLLFRTQQ